ncbi:MAG: beta-N-acetylhexosaminidase [Clostridia bacterium]|nr:beta-N-acetylhexosaminidase [Clostridia bacterium]
MLGVMIDCSRNAVMKPEKVKQFAGIIRKMGYDTLMLYTEDTYEIDNQPLFGYMRGRYTMAEIKDIDRYCNDIGIELVPCIQTLAHLGRIFKWQEYKQINDCDDILFVDEEKTYELIDDMLRTVSECFTSKKIHIGMDEAERVGLGKYREQYGMCERFDIINRHLHRVCDISEKYGLTPMIWSDMFCRLASDSQSYHECCNISDIIEKANLPENVSLVYWDYYSSEYEHYANMIKINQAFEKEVIFAGGAWTWKGFAPDNTMSIKNTEPALKACRDNGVKNVFMTVWGDDGAECSCFAILPALMYTAQKFKGNDSTDDMKYRFKEITGYDFDSFTLLDKFDTPGGKHNYNPSKYLLYNDVFCGLNDYRCDGTEDDYYKNLACELEKVDVSEQYGYIFKMYRQLADVLSVKSDLGIRLKSAYDAGDTEELKTIADDCGAVVKKLEDFHSTFEKYWFEENKPYGFDIQDLRVGGVIQRVKSCRDRLLRYIGGETECIPELEEKRIAEDCGIHWAGMVSVNVISHSLLV